MQSDILEIALCSRRADEDYPVAAVQGQRQCGCAGDRFRRERRGLFVGIVLPHTYQAFVSAGHDGARGTYDQVTVSAVELYDLATDVGETTNIAAQHPDIVRRIEAFAEFIRAELGDSLTKRAGRAVRAAGRIAAAQ